MATAAVIGANIFHAFNIIVSFSSFFAASKQGSSSSSVCSLLWQIISAEHAGHFHARNKKSRRIGRPEGLLTRRLTA
jgi:hypothetical protein